MKEKSIKEKDTEIVRERPDYEKEIIAIVRSKNSPKAISKLLEDYHARDLAEALPYLEQRERESLYRLTETECLAEMFEYLDDAEIYLDELDIRRAVTIIENMEPDCAVESLRRMNAQKRKLLLELVDEECRKAIMLLASYDEDKIAAHMTTNFVTIPCNIGVREAMRSVVAQAAEHDNISMIYVLDESGIYYGAISLKNLIIARDGTKLEDIIVTAYPYLYADEDTGSCLELLKDYSEDSIPILSDDNHILGVITAQDMIEVVDDELGDDYAKLAGLSAEEDLDEPLRASIRKRLPWLTLLLGLGLVVSSVVGIFEAIVSQLTLIICFQSLILDMAGNVGTQSLAVTIRVLTDEQLTGKQKWLLVRKELRVGLSNGMILGLLSCVAIGLYLWLFKEPGAGAAFAISGCIGIALLLAMIVSSLVGTTVPIAFKSLGVDPAVASGPLITTINDLVAVVAYYGLAGLFLVQLAGGL